MNKLTGKQISVLLMSIFIVIIAGVAIFFAIYAAKLPKICGNTYYIQSSNGYLAYDPSSNSILVTPNTNTNGLLTKWNFACSSTSNSGVLLGWLSVGGYQIRIGSNYTQGIQSTDPTQGTLFLLIPQGGDNSFIITRLSQAVVVANGSVQLSPNSSTTFKFIVVD